jgi:hypothetical protein
LPWLELIETGQGTLPDSGLEIDYTRYGAGEAHLAWLDEQVSLRFPEGQGRQMLLAALSGFLAALAEREAGIGHLKCILEGEGVPGGGVKLSFTTLEEPGWQERLPEIGGTQAGLLVNARVEMDAATLKDLLERALAGSGLEFSIQNGMAFHPPQPRPTHRF